MNMIEDQYAELIIAIQKSLGLTITELAKQIGASRSAVSSWVNGGATPQKKFREALEKLAGTANIGKPKSQIINISGLSPAYQDQIRTLADLLFRLDALEKGAKE